MDADIKSRFKLLKLLYSKEKLYVDEISKFSALSFLGNGENGWIIAPPDFGSEDWGLVRLVGSIELASEHLNNSIELCEHFCSADSIRIIVSECEYLQERALFHKFKLAERIIVFSSEDKTAELNLPAGCSFYKAKNFDCVLHNGKTIASLESCAASKNFIEVSLHVNNEFRNQGIGSCLLAHSAKNLKNANRNLVYWAEEDNIVSIKTAKKAGLKQIEKIYSFKI